MENYRADKLYNPQTSFLQNHVSKPLLVLNVVMSLVYFAGLLMLPKGNEILWWSLMAGEVFHVWMVLTYCYTVWKMEHEFPFDSNFKPPVDVFITVAGEPVDIVETTVLAAKAMRYPKFKVHILNDGYVAKKDNWKEIIELAKRLKVNCITRTVPGGAKAGNFNNGLRETKNPYVVVFDADHVPHEDFLEKTMGYFVDPLMGFVQSPQYYKNHGENYVTGGAWEQQELFFGALCKGKNRLNAAFMCGTNMVLSRKAVTEAGGMCEHNIAEDFLTSLFVHSRGYKSVYVPEVLSEGLAPEDFLSYYKQQFRWARGSLEVIFRHNPIFMKGLSWGQRIQYLASASFYLSGIVVLLNAIFPLAFFFLGWVPFETATMLVAILFLPYIFLTVYVLQLSSNYSYTYRALAFSMSSFTIHLSALWAVLTGQKSGFSVTSKKQLEGNFLHLTIPHMAYIALVVTGTGFAVMREGFSASVVTNLSWALFNVGIFVPFILASSSLMKSSLAESEFQKNEEEAEYELMETSAHQSQYSTLVNMPNSQKKSTPYYPSDVSDIRIKEAGFRIKNNES